MARYLFTVWPFPGHVHPNVAIAHALGRMGHETAFYTGASLRDMLEADGVRCFPFEHVDERAVWDAVLDLDAMSLQWWKASRRKALLAEWLLGTVGAQLRDLSAIVARWRPDVIVCDPGMWGALLVLHETARIPLAVMSYFAACMLPGPEGPIVGLPLPRPEGGIGRASRRLLRAVVGILAADVRRGAEALRAQHGLAAMRTTPTAYGGQMPLYLVPSTPGYDRSRRDLPASVHYVGPCQWDKPTAIAPPAWLADLPKDRPVVYVTEGTMHAKPPTLLRATIEGLASLPIRVIATTGKHRDPDSIGLGILPENVRVEPFVPHSDLLPHLDAVVTTGGTGTVLASLSTGVPLVVVPMAWDQPENAWRVHEAGAGIRVAPGDCTPARIRAAVERVLREPSFRENARRLGAELAGYGGATQAAELLDGLARKGAGPAAVRDEPSGVAGFGGAAPDRHSERVVRAAMCIRTSE